MSANRLFLSGIRCEGRHGANPGEKDSPQPFVVDLDLEVRVDADAIGETADYRAITQARARRRRQDLVRPPGVDRGGGRRCGGRAWVT